MSGAVEHLRGETACHGDLRADNTLIAPATVDTPERAVLVDWNWLMRGPEWTDFDGVLPLARADGLDVDRWLERSALTERNLVNLVYVYRAVGVHKVDQVPSRGRACERRPP